MQIFIYEARYELMEVHLDFTSVEYAWKCAV